MNFNKTKPKTQSKRAITETNKKASFKGLEKNGFEKIGIIKDYYLNKGKYVNRTLYWKII